jgi:hypothetical protein
VGEGDPGVVRLRVALSAVSVVALAFVIAFAGFSLGQATASAPEGSEVGVVIHGDWNVTVKNGDGTVAQEHSFHNDFNGASTIAPILAHQRATGRYWLTLSDQSGAGQNPCGDPAAAASSCFVFEADDPNGSVPFWFGNLTVTSTSGQVGVTATIIATRAGQFNHVRMLLSTCAGTATPNDCHPGSYGNFSTRTLPAPISVVAGQQILVTVTYTFSPAP